MPKSYSIYLGAPRPSELAPLPHLPKRRRPSPNPTTFDLLPSSSHPAQPHSTSRPPPPNQAAITQSASLSPNVGVVKGTYTSESDQVASLSQSPRWWAMGQRGKESEEEGEVVEWGEKGEGNTSRGGDTTEDVDTTREADDTTISFLRPPPTTYADSDRSLSFSHSHSHSYLSTSLSQSPSQSHSLGSIAHLPRYSFPPRSTSLISTLLLSLPNPPKTTSLLTYIISLTSSHPITLKNNPCTTLSVADMHVGDQGAADLKLTLWRDVADRWAGEEEGCIRQGDIVYFSGIALKTQQMQGGKVGLAATATGESAYQICYRTRPLPGDHEARRYRAEFTPAHRCSMEVKALLEWLEAHIGVRR